MMRWVACATAFVATVAVGVSAGAAAGATAGASEGASEGAAADAGMAAAQQSAVAGRERRFGVIQNRKYALAHELTLLGGIYPVDPYYKGVTGTLGYTLHFSDSFAWEIASFTYSYNVRTDLRHKLEQTALATGGEPLQLPEIEWVVASHLVLKPLYGKEAWLNTEVVHLEAYLQGGPAAVQRSAPVQDLGLGVDFGGGLRLWLSQVWSLRLDLGELVFVEDVNGKLRVRQALHASLGFAANLRGEE